jgi:hypothetical protein
MWSSWAPVCMLVIIRLVSCNQCITDTFAVHREEAEIQRRRVLEPLLNSAVLLSRDLLLPAVLRIDLAHRFMRIHDRFSKDCIDSGWKHALSHKICATYLRWKPFLNVSGSMSTYCVSFSLSLLLNACQSHVEPWGLDSGYCQSLPDKCADRTPFWGACDVWGHNISKRSKLYGNSQDSHSRHRTKTKHHSHRERERVDGHARFRNHMADRLHHATESKFKNTRNASFHTARPTHVVTRVKVAVLYDRSVKHWDLRKCADAGRIICIPRASPALRRIVQSWLPECEIRTYGSAPLFGVVSAQCGAFITWAPSAEFIMRSPCEGTNSSLYQTIGLTPKATDFLNDCNSNKIPSNARPWIWEPNDHVYLFNATSLSLLEFDRSLSHVCSRYPRMHPTKLASCK